MNLAARLRLSKERDGIETAATTPTVTADYTKTPVQKQQRFSYENVRSGASVAMTACCEIFKDAMEFWSKVEQGAQDAIATKGQKVIGAIAAASAYNKQYGSVGSRSAPRTRRTGPGKRTLIEFCTDAD